MENFEELFIKSEINAINKLSEHMEKVLYSGWFRKKIGEKKVFKWFKITIPTFAFNFEDDYGDHILMAIYFEKKIKLFPIGTEMENIYETNLH